MGCGTSTIKYLLFFFNLIFALGGLALLIVGSIIQWNLNFYDEILGENIIVPSILLIVVGSLVFVIAFLGCCGAIKESHCMMTTYAVFVLIIFVAQLTGGILAIVYRDQIDDFIRTAMTDLQGQYDTQEIAKQTWDSLQEGFHCCGVDSWADWAGKVPDSCSCTSDQPDCVNNVYQRGCFETFTDFVHMFETILGGIAIGIAVIELIGVIFACTLASAIKKKKYIA